MGKDRPRTYCTYVQQGFCEEEEEGVVDEGGGGGGERPPRDRATGDGARKKEWKPHLGPARRATAKRDERGIGQID